MIIILIHLYVAVVSEDNDFVDIKRICIAVAHGILLSWILVNEYSEIVVYYYLITALAIKPNRKREQIECNWIC